VKEDGVDVLKPKEVGLAELEKRPSPLVAPEKVEDDADL
jgi:hypothetical protein